MTSKRTFLVGISGASSSGKTTVARLVNSLLPNSVLIHQDDFYYPDDKIPYDEARGESNWDSADAVDFPKLIHTLKEIKADPETVYHVDSLELDDHKKFSLDENFVEAMKTFVSEQEKTNGLDNVRIVILDGFLLFNNTEVLDLLDAKFFFTAKYQTLKDRRAARHGYNTIAGFWVDPPNYFDNFVWAEYFLNHKHLFKKDTADLETHVKETGGVIATSEIQQFQNENDTNVDQLVSSVIKAITRKIGDITLDSI
ncbi:unnamed protein product [Kuraishia capsulata CBS 1993]|uniref:Phosphoribulokinase/uridine kinase domain-containing protein n=1 Tax=Kuraishia capsulata CBS 1993 TaxID=1382522 RepID=W6MFC6_9ASCO|nr:uncharacterized protein KUCA_T00000432001 [Kuraishia capsulata CBS 1993]CDK24469.1 unnamed protein product [Kuraishia capsulata CBS 1993]